jgi:hypothetical protein
VDDIQSQLPIINARIVHAPAKPHALKRLKIDFYPPLNLPAQIPTYYCESWSCVRALNVRHHKSNRAT